MAAKFVVLYCFSSVACGLVFPHLAVPANTEPPEQWEPAASQSKADDTEKESRAELMAASSLFNSASSDNTEEQQAVEDALREAMSSPSQIGRPDRRVDDESDSMCLPDFTNACPRGWIQEGVLCVGINYAGPCTAEVDISDMNVEQKRAFSDYCSVAFPCQADCVQDFRQACPSLWREIANGKCDAPRSYTGVCPMRLDASTMSDSEKHAWSVRCAARWPCAAREKHSYDDVCPSGWSLQSGHVCQAPEHYAGPCERTAYMSSASEGDKKSFGATCRVSWPAAPNCMRDYSAACPSGWHDGGDECIAPFTYKICSSRKSFSLMTPAAKEEWAKNCKVEFPCKA